MQSLVRLLFAVSLLATTSFAADQVTCKSRKDLVDACFVIHGRVYVSNGTPLLRIWVVGTHHVLGVTARDVADDADDPLAPAHLLRKLGGNQRFVFGDFEVCPFTKESVGKMQFVSVQSVKHLVPKPYGWHPGDDALPAARCRRVE